MKVLVAQPATDFNFDSACSTPFMSAPSSPKLFGEFYFSAPTSPTRSTALYRDFNNISFVHTTSVWQEEEETAGKQKSNDSHDDEDFAFDFSGQLEKPSLTADELFDGGKIRPLNTNTSSSVSSPKKKISSGPLDKGNLFSSNSNHRSTRSLSDFVFEQESTEPISAKSSSSSSFFFSKWRLKDFLLFRSASEGRAIGKDPLKKYTALSSKKHQDLRISSFRSTDGSGSGSSRRKGPVSPHEIIYTSNRAVQDELKKKTYLPYRNGLLGCIGFNPSVNGLARGLNSIRRG